LLGIVVVEHRIAAAPLPPIDPIYALPAVSPHARTSAAPTAAPFVYERAIGEAERQGRVYAVLMVGSLRTVRR
jgi:hypothetical protein